MKVLDNDQWVSSQFIDCQFGDKRITKRLMKIASNMLAAPDKSIIEQNVEWADVKAAYRFYDNDRVTFGRVAEQHWQQTRQTKPGRYLLISDTTDIDHTSHNATTGLGMLGDGKGRGMQLHSCLMFNADEKLVYGIAGSLIHYRKFKPEGETRTQRLARDRESVIWGKLVDMVGRAPDGSKWVHVFDRGGDNFEAMCHIRLTDNDWVIRAAQLHRKVIDESGNHVHLKDAIQDARKLGSYELYLRSRPGVEARTAKMEILTTKVTYLAPRNRSKWLKACGITELEMNVVIVQEVDPPKGVKPIYWVLLTSLPVDTLSDAWLIVEYYEHRWLIEEYHKVIKSACIVEDHALRSGARLEPLIALISVIGIRLFQLKLIGRSQPEAKAATHVPASWLKCLKVVRPKSRTTGMTVYEFFRDIAKVGGFLGRKGDGEPGWQTIWRGYKKMQSILDAMRLLDPI